MLKALTRIGSLASFLFLTSVAHSQALPTAVGKGFLQIGGGYSLAMPDYAQKNIQGITGFGDFDFLPHFGVEAEYHYVALITPTDIGENSFFGGPRYVFTRNRYSFYAKALVGIGTIDIQEIEDNPAGGAGTYFAYGAGAGLDIRITNHIVVRAVDAEYQHWNYKNGLTPIVFTAGVAYRFR